jgi:hypothetical protein
VFKAEYEQHGIGDHHFLNREQYVRYALFLRGLAEQAWSCDKITRLRSFAETVRPTAPALQIHQHWLVVPVVALLVGLLLDILKQPENWKGGKVAALMRIGQVFVGVIFILWARRTVTFTIPNNRHKEIERFLQWAEIDIKEQKAKDTVSG